MEENEMKSVRMTNGRKRVLLDAAALLILLAIVIFIISIFAELFADSDRPAAEVAADVTAVESQDTESSVTEAGELTFRKIFGLNAADYDGVVYYCPVSNMDACELLVVRVRETEQTDALVKAVNSRIESQKSVFKGYAPKQFEQLGRAKVLVTGHYVFYVVSDDADEYARAFSAAL